jgi:thiamine transport system substrate-binding protein
MGADEPPQGSRRRRTPGQLGRRLAAVAIALILALAAYGTFEYVESLPAPGTTQLTIYTYVSLFDGNCAPPANVTEEVFAPFERLHHVQIELECPGGTLVNSLLQQKNAPGADLVIGLDEITTGQADADHLLIPYTSPQLANVPADLVAELAPDHATTPYEWGYLGIDYMPSFYSATHGAVASSAFPQFAQNSSWARQLMIEDPVNDITGEEFLLWEIEYYQQVLHQSNWGSWWEQVDPDLSVAPDWPTAFSDFTTPPNNPEMVVSYATDPAYAAYFGTPGAYNSTVSSVNGSAYGWKTIYGIGIVNGTKHLTLDQEFIDWFLSGNVQSQIPTNEWEYPANETVPVPPAYNWTLNASSVHALNDGVSLSTIQDELTTSWLPEWQQIYDQYGCPHGGCAT